MQQFQLSMLPLLMSPIFPGIMANDTDPFEMYNITESVLSNKSHHCVPKSPFPSPINVISYCYVLPTVCAIGILGNIANLITLASNQLRAVSYMYLKGLGIADMLCMIFVLIFASFEIINSSHTYRHYLTYYGVAWYRAHLMLPLINWSITAGILIVVALTVERYISVAWPILFREWNSPKRAKAIIIAAYMISMACYIPMYWQYEVVPICSHSQKKSLTLHSLFENDNETFLFNETTVTAQRTHWASTDNRILLHHAAYQAYKLTREILLKMIPMVAMAFLNINIIFAFKKVTRRRRRLNSTGTNQNSREQRSLLFLLAGIVILFFVCNIPASINLSLISDQKVKRQSYTVFRAIANLSEITNHALNFYSFCLCSSDYRQTFLRKFPCVKRMQESAEDVKRRINNSMARVNASRGPSVMTHNDKHALILNSSLKSPYGPGHMPHPLRRAISSDALLRLDHCQLRDIHGRRYGHHYAEGKYHPNGKQTALGSIRKHSTCKKYDSLEYILDHKFDSIPEDGIQGFLSPPVHSFKRGSSISEGNRASSAIALVNFEFSSTDETKVDIHGSTMTYISADFMITTAQNALTDGNGQVLLGNGKIQSVDDEDSDSLTYSSANDVYL